jgi:hypothetical protein
MATAPLISQKDYNSQGIITDKELSPQQAAGYQIGSALQIR